MAVGRSLHHAVMSPTHAMTSWEHRRRGVRPDGKPRHHGIVPHIMRDTHAISDLAQAYALMFGCRLW
ncbi:pepsin A-like [Platysternon megacephalum]|uniref:Pepsin A-like n=1 Tax=Platysternon megacephalum TaxID=55544 RepID=A0A4D9E5I7_9SAUR|nr:pepsin A-like [Platysternon megacephalum]